MRDRCTPNQLWAHARLDAVRLGIDVPAHEVNLALWLLGDGVGRA